MALDDYIEPEVGVAVAFTAAIMSPKVRGLLRRGAVYGLAGALMAGDAVTALARGVKRGVTTDSATTGSVASLAAAPAETPAATTVDAGSESTDPGFAPITETSKPAPKARAARTKPADSGDDTNE